MATSSSTSTSTTAGGPTSTTTTTTLGSPGGHYPGAHGEPAGTSVSVDPDNSLRGGSTVMVSGRGFNASDTYAVLQCSAVVTGGGDCDQASAITGTTRADGTFGPQPMVLKARIHTANQGDVTCDPAGSCSIAASNFTHNPAIPAAYHNLSFVPDGSTLAPAPTTAPAPAPTAVLPATGIGRSLPLAGSILLAGAWLCRCRGRWGRALSR
ncbi:MAG: neocarzinostatin apoprotein domain-containing protein [Acidimicrobiales bacterium]